MGPGGGAPGPPLDGSSSIDGILVIFFILSTVPFSIVTVLFSLLIGFDVFSWERRASLSGKLYFCRLKQVGERTLLELKVWGEEGEEAAGHRAEEVGEASLKQEEAEVVDLMREEEVEAKMPAYFCLEDWPSVYSVQHFFEESSAQSKTNLNSQ